jgi:hypothetical protein
VAGFYVTDGVSVKDISTNRIGSYFSTLNDNFSDLYAAHDENRKLIYWGVRNGASSGAYTHVLIYNYASDKWSVAQSTHYALFSIGPYSGTNPNTAPQAYLSSFTVGSFTGTPGSAVFTTGEMEPSRGGYSRVVGVKPLVDATVNAVTIAVGTRNNRTDAVSYTAETTANSRSGFCDFRSEARYHRARMTVTGTFNSAQGIEPQVEISGSE